MSKHGSRAISGGRLLAVAVLLAAGYLVGVSTHEAAVQAEVRRNEPVQEPFQTGDQRCELVLREMSVTLSRLDARIERIEKLATQFANRDGQPLPVEIRSR
jgi:hypothetical protein